ncbi:5-oxoprolinase subunit PxpB [Paenibacillus sp. S3N08]|uniref:5-oxoprolinase subunit PxpB n=2 Tax=Paenibacillus agricola TaxID=2716264 RepID=A0ABX0J2N5_9BACL|nr:5-oxoprolinase subunit PxpB [Paenibacillus agricola]
MPSVEKNKKVAESDVGEYVELSPLGDTVVIVTLGNGTDQHTHRKVQALSLYLNRYPFPGLVEIVPAFVTVAVYYDPIKLRDPLTGASWRSGAGGTVSPYTWICRILEGIIANLADQAAEAPRTVHIPVYYGGEWGPDLPAVAQHNGLTVDEVIELHAAPEYLVHMIGFAPGFPYLGGMSRRIAAPRRSTPRLTIAAGTVGIGGQQTGIYPISTPGGWQLIGRTPVTLFRRDNEAPSLLQAGDRVRFQPISHKQYLEWRRSEHEYSNYTCGSSYDDSG